MLLDAGANVDASNAVSIEEPKSFSSRAELV